MIWEFIRTWINRHPGERVILIGDLNGLILGGKHNFKHPMRKSLVETDERLLQFCINAKGTIWSPKGFTWKRGEKRAKLGHGIFWNFTLTTPKAKFNETAHQKFDHGTISFGLPAEESARKLQPARRPLAPTDRIDAVFLQEWHEAIQGRMLPASDETDGETLMAMQKVDQEVMKEEILKLQLQKSLGENKMPADLFKKAPESFRRRGMSIVNLILTGHYKCKPTDLEVRVILLCKDSDNPELFSNYRPITLCNVFYQLLNIIKTSRLKDLVEHYSVLESSQFGFRNSSAVMLVIQKANLLIREAMKNDGTLI